MTGGALVYHVGTEKVTWIQSSGGPVGSPQHREARVSPDRYSPTIHALNKNGLTLCTAALWPEYVFLDLDWATVTGLPKCADCQLEHDVLSGEGGS